MFAIHLPSRGWWCGNRDDVREYSECIEDAAMSTSQAGIVRLCETLGYYPEGRIVELVERLDGFHRVN